MRKKKINLFVFIDSYGHELVKKGLLLHDKLKFKKSVRMQFGYSSTAIPSILTGESPSKHGQFTFFYRNPDGKSMFKVFDNILFKLIPSFISKRRKFRNLLSKIFKRYFKITGYFDLYSIPFNQLKFFDYSEKKDLFKPNAFSNCQNIADVLEENNIPYFITNWRKSEIENFAELFEEIKSGQKKFVFGYFAGLDGVQHMHTKDSSETNKKIQFYSDKFEQLFEVLEKEYDEYEVAVFSDHGMTTLTSEIDIQEKIRELNEEFGVDYLSFLDSTMARFWYFTEDARKNIREKLSSINEIELLSREKLEEWGVYYPDHKYGEDIYLTKPGVQIVPSDMGAKSLPGMHGYTPDDVDSDAMWMSNYEPRKFPKEVKDIFACMIDKIEEIKKEKNS